eukprot:357415-Chlamydomonas_euryale.AAC.4
MAPRGALFQNRALKHIFGPHSGYCSGSACADPAGPVDASRVDKKALARNRARGGISPSDRPSLPPRAARQRPAARRHAHPASRRCDGHVSIRGREGRRCTCHASKVHGSESIGTLYRHAQAAAATAAALTLTADCILQRLDGALYWLEALAGRRGRARMLLLLQRRRGAAKKGTPARVCLRSGRSSGALLCGSVPNGGGRRRRGSARWLALSIAIAHARPRVCTNCMPPHRCGLAIKQFLIEISKDRIAVYSGTWLYIHAHPGRATPVAFYVSLL